MEYEVVESRIAKNEWRVEAIDHERDGAVYVALFSGPEARERAAEYAAWKNANGREQPSVDRARERTRARA